MKTTLITAVLTAACVTPAFATDRDPNQHEPGQRFEQKKVEILQRIEQKIANAQAERACVQAAASHDDLKACRDKFRGEQKGSRQDRNN